MTKPRVCIALATGILGGPGKGLAQFLSSGGQEGCFPLVLDFHTGNELVETDYERAVKATGATMASLRQRRALDFGLVEQGLELVREHKITVLQSHGYKGHVLCWLLSRKTGLPWIAYVHGWTRENMKVRLYHAIEHTLLPAADVVVAVSESLRRRLLPWVRKRCRVIPNAIVPEEMQAHCSREEMRRELGLPDDAVAAGVVGRLSPEKGQSVFLRALAQARQQDARLRGVLVGDGQEYERLRREAAALGVSDACIFTGHVRQTAACYQALDIQVMPSFSEGMPNAALEGMLAGLPLIASNVGGVPEVVVDGLTGHLVPVGDAVALSHRLLELAASPERRAALGQAGQQRALSEFDPKTRVSRMLALYHEVLGG